MQSVHDEVEISTSGVFRWEHAKMRTEVPEMGLLRYIVCI